ncbi:MAG TPA: efflux RND transporter periplasmic adaptor subunit [Candidatus Cybelea sp.]|nr:efflux RND transporter periplasmic adaptor subunit [Candidatus Cybelea sp.]
MRKRFIIVAAVLLVVFGGIAGFQAFKAVMIKQYFAGFKPPPVTVSAATAVAETWNPFLTSVGTLAAVAGVEVSPQVAGIVTKINFESGQTVRKGAVLVNLDDSVDQADLKSLQARSVLARLDFDRTKELFAHGNASKATLDQKQSVLSDTEAQVARTRQIIDQKAVAAPFDGKLGIRQVDIGQYLSPGSKIIWLQSLDPIYVNFPLPEQYVGQIAIGGKVQINVDAYKDQIFQGTITAIDAKVDESTRNINVQATLPNSDGKLYAGMFANVKVLLPVSIGVVTVPETAVSQSLYGDAVFLIKDGPAGADGKPTLTVTRQFVTLGQRQGDKVAVTDGVQPGERVVVSGQLKLNTGTAVMIDNSIDLNAPRVLSKE